MFPRHLHIPKGKSLKTRRWLHREMADRPPHTSRHLHPRPLSTPERGASDRFPSASPGSKQDPRHSRDDLWNERHGRKSGRAGQHLPTWRQLPLPAFPPSRLRAGGPGAGPGGPIKPGARGWPPFCSGVVEACARAGGCWACCRPEAMAGAGWAQQCDEGSCLVCSTVPEPLMGVNGLCKGRGLLGLLQTRSDGWAQQWISCAVWRVGLLCFTVYFLLWQKRMVEICQKLSQDLL
ncbi:uncharacterized protein LOC121079315 isoform X3 [Cygnus olor]|uniref:uncharacterized protein LOC121079315 isoform X3 n=1 Tax=Cygnus olor TaxID=8869 RepID=UPI001ADE9768|nr:uncharacterized protein LOC121079315 isoform X3 [Cygnus olor]